MTHAHLVPLAPALGSSVPLCAQLSFLALTITDKVLVLGLHLLRRRLSLDAALGHFPLQMPQNKSKDKDKMLGSTRKV